MCVYSLIQELENQVQLSWLSSRVYKVCQVQTPGANQLLAPEVRVTPAFILTYAKGQGKKKEQECDLTSILT
jgi:hypothetical protein